MRVILQRVTQGSVTVEGSVVGRIGRGFVALVGITHADTQATAALLAKKTAHLRVFEDDAGKMNLSMLETGGEILVISQFTLYADARKGRRPSFIDAAPPDLASPLVEHFAACLAAEGVHVIERGIFGANMQVAIHNDGPVTIILDSQEFGVQ
jgi:D-aminoacyl-tRNA deacylase